MKTSDLISQLTKELKPVQTVRFGLLDLLKVFGVGLFCVFSAIAALGVRLDFHEQVISLNFVLSNLWLLLLAALSASAAFSLSIPSSQRRAVFVLPTITVALVLVSTAYSFLTYSDPLLYLGHGFSCGLKIFIISILPAGLLFYLVRRAAALRRDLVGVLILLSGASFGLLGVQLTCGESTPLHLIFWHLLPAALIAVAGIWIAKKILPRI